MLGCAALVVALAGCAPAVQPQSTTGSSGSGVAAPAVAATAAPVAGDDCTDLLAPASLAAILHQSKNVSVYTGDLALAAIGGFGCGYADDPNGSPSGYPPASLVSVIVAPSVIVDPSELAASLAPRHCGPDAGANTATGGGPDCTATRTVAGWWYSLSVTTGASKSGSVKPSAFNSIQADLEKSLRNVVAPERVNVVRPFDCAAASAPHARLSGSRVIEDNPLGPIYYQQPGEDDYPFEPPTDQEVLAAAYLLAGPTACFTSDAGVGITVYPGGASAYAQCVEGLGAVSTTTDPGVASAWANIHYALGADQICATDGKSTVSVTDLYRDDTRPWDAKTLESLGALLVPVFAGSASLSAPWTAALPAASAANTVQPLVGGDCAKLLDSSAAAAILGEPTTRNPASAGDPTLATIGGLDCQYVVGNPHGNDDPDVVTAVIAPSAIADPAELAASLASPVCDSKPTVCTGTAVVNGWWYSLDVEMNSVGPAIVAMGAPIERFKAIAANLERTLKSAPAPGRVSATRPFDCAAIAKGGWPNVRSRALPGSRFWAGYLFGNDTEIRSAAFLLAGPVTCKIPSLDNVIGAREVPWYLTVYPGGASAYRQCTQVDASRPRKPISLPGVKSAFLVTRDADGGPLICATDGTSTVVAVSYVDGHFNGPDRTSLTSMLGLVFAALE